jgi:hypothetical protein
MHDLFAARQRKIVLAVAISGIAATLLLGGTTAHRRFKITIDINDCKCTVSSVRGRGRLFTEL